MDVVVPGFGDLTMAVVLAIGVMPEGPNTLNGTGTGAYLAYQYDFGVFATPEVAAYTRLAGTDSLETQPGTPAAGCPQGDGDEVVVTVALDSTWCEGPIARSAFSVVAPDTSLLYAAAPADSDATLIDGKYRTTITLSQYGACGTGELAVRFGSMVIGTADVDMRSVDINTWVSPGVVSANDLARFGVSYESPPKPYDRCADYRFFGEVTVSDAAYFAVHYGHDTSGGSMALYGIRTTDAGLRLDVQDEVGLAGERRLWSTLSVENLEPFEALAVSLRSDNPRLRFLGWHPDPEYSATTFGTEVVRDGIRQTFLGILGTGRALSPVVELGRVEYEVLGDDPLTLSGTDLSFLIADLEIAGGGRRVFATQGLAINELPQSYRYELAQNVPNPFNPSTTIAYSLARDSDVALTIYDVRGTRVRTLAHQPEKAGLHRVPWDGTNDRGVRVSSGVYFYRLVAGSFRDTKKMVLLR